MPAGHWFSQLGEEFETATIADTNNSFTKGVCNGLYIGVAGDITVNKASGGTQLFKNMPVGFAPIRCIGIMDTGTTAVTGDIVALY